MPSGISADGTRYRLSSEIYMLTAKPYKGKKVRIVLDDDDDPFQDPQFSKTLVVCFLGGKYIEPFEVLKSQVELL